MTALNIFAIVVASGSLLLGAWWLCDRIEDANTFKRGRLAQQVRVRQRTSAVVQMQARRPQ